MEIHQLEFLDTLIQGYKCSGSMNGFKFDPKSISAFPERNLASGFKLGDLISDPHQFGVLPSGPNPINLVQSSGMVSEVVDSPEEHDFTDAILKYISQMLMEEEDLEHKPCMLQDCMALQAAEKSFYDVLGEKYPPWLSFDENGDSPKDNFTSTCSSHGSNSSTAVDNCIESNWFRDRDKFESSITQSSHVNLQTFGSSNTFSDAVDGPVDSLLTPFQPIQVPEPCIDSRIVSQFKIDPNFTQFLQYKDHRNHYVERDGNDHSPNGSRGKKNHYREDIDYAEGGRSNKQLASSADESDVQSELYDKVLLCPGLNLHLHQESELCPDDDGARTKLQQNGQSKGSNVGRPRGKRQGNKREVVDLRTLLTHCAQAVASNNGRTANEVLKRIRQHSSPHGDGTERLAHFFASALEARLAGAGTSLYTVFTSSGISAADILKGYQVYVKACPFKKLSNFYANQSIGKLSRGATRLHIIDFGVLYGFQWPCLIQRLSVRESGPPKLRITGIELPQPGFRPAERVEDTGRRLKKYCERFNVPFEYNAIAKKWDTIQLEDLKIDRDEVLVVNSLYRLGHVPDETVVASSPRDAVLNLIRRINPDLFVHGVINGTYNAPFFVTRFREALFHFSALFDMFEATVPREDHHRMMFEKEIFGRDVMNVIACEGTERVERPETYKQWQVRNVRAGLRQLPLDREIVEDVRAKVRKGYNKDFVVDEDSNWMLQGWKGRIIYAISCWKPAQQF